MSKKDEIKQGIEILLKSMSREELAYKLGISGSSLVRYKNGKINNPKWVIVKTIRKLIKQEE